MRGRGTLILFLLVVAVGGFVWWEDTSSTSGGDPSSVPGPPLDPLVDVDPARVTAVELLDGATVYRRVRSGPGWGADPAGRGVAEFLANLQGLGTIQRMKAPTTELADFGLAPPRRSIRLQVEGRPASVLIELGRKNPALTGLYVRFDQSGDVILAGALLDWEFDKLAERLGDASRQP